MGPVGHHGPEKQVAGQQIPQFIADRAVGDLTAVNGLPQDVLDHGFPLFDELVLHDVVERGVAGHLDKHRAHGAGMLAGLGAYQLPRRSKSPRSEPVSGGTATWRMPSMNAANTSSAFDGQRRYTVALLALAVVATASTVNPSYPCCCSNRNVTSSNSASRGDHGEDCPARLAIWVTAPTIEPIR